MSAVYFNVSPRETVSSNMILGTEPNFRLGAVARSLMRFARLGYGKHPDCGRRINDHRCGCGWCPERCPEKFGVTNDL
jgi:hypothetical protein